MTVLVPGGSSPGHWAEAEGRLPAETLTGWVGVAQRAHPWVLPTPRRRSGCALPLLCPRLGLWFGATVPSALTWAPLMRGPRGRLGRALIVLF